MSGFPAVTPGYMRNWGRHTHGSPLYAHLVEVIAEDRELLRIINRIENRPPPNVLFAAVQFLLLENPKDPLASFYPSLTDSPSSPGGAGPPFRDFVIEHEPELVRIGEARYTQTNECRRCVALLPAVMEAPFSSFHLVDIGTSAGLNLALDRYHYSWNGLSWGPASTVTLQAELRGIEPALHEVGVLSRTGLDLSPVDPADPDERRWLEALIWPEHHERRQRLQAALDLLGGVEFEMVAGDALETLGPVLAALPSGEPAVVMNSFSLIQLDTEQKRQLDGVVRTGRESRPIHRVSMELLHRDEKWARLQVDSGDGWRELGQGHPHGEWVEFYARP